MSRNRAVATHQRVVLGVGGGIAAYKSAELARALMQYGLEGSFPAGSDDDRRADCTIKLWLYPLPPSELGTLSLVSPSFGPGPASCPLDGRVIVAAATQVQPYWA